MALTDSHDPATSAPADPRLILAAQGLAIAKDFPRHQHSAWVVIIYDHGIGEAVFDDRHVPFGVGTVICVPPATPYAESSADGFRSLYLAISGLFPEADGVQVFAERESRPFHRLASLLLEEHRLGPPSGQMQQALFESLLVFLHEWRRLRPLDSAGGRLRAILGANVENPRFEIRDALATLPWSAAHLRKAFARETGCTPRAYLNRLRIDKARRLLRIGGFSVKQVAHAVGIADAHYFSRLFRKLAGCWPADYQRAHGGGPKPTRQPPAQPIASMPEAMRER